MVNYEEFYFRKRAEASVKSEERIVDKELKSQERLESKRLKYKRDIEAKRLKAASTSRQAKFKQLRTLPQGQFLSQEQEMLGDMFGANPNNKVLFGSNDSESRPQINGFLFSGEGGLTKNDRETASMFGI